MRGCHACDWVWRWVVITEREGTLPKLELFRDKSNKSNSLSHHLLLHRRVWPWQSWQLSCFQNKSKNSWEESLELQDKQAAASSVGSFRMRDSSNNWSTIQDSETRPADNVISERLRGPLKDADWLIAFGSPIMLSAASNHTLNSMWNLQTSSLKLT